MDRRAFLSLGRRGRQRVLELSCERLYVRWVDAMAHAARPSVHELFPETGEPPTQVAGERTDDLLEELERKLADAEVVRVIEERWLDDMALMSGVKRRIEAFERRGGRVERVWSDVA